MFFQRRRLFNVNQFATGKNKPVLIGLSSTAAELNKATHRPYNL